MLKKAKAEPADSVWDSEIRLLAWLATCVSILAFLFYYQRSEVLLYGDAIAHINIARRVFDSKTPGLLQLGTVWLPLPHLLMIPFLVSKQLWQSGAGGSIPSMAAYVFGVIGIFRLVRGTLSKSVFADRPAREAPARDGPARLATWTTAVIFALNPNLIYMQSTAMGETLYLAFFIWAVVFFSEWAHGEAKALTKCGLCLAAACLTRYDGWFLAVAMVGVVLLQLIPTGNRGSKSISTSRSGSVVIRFLLIAGAAPALWLAYNAIIYRNPLEFENGPYSAKAIERKTQTAGTPGHPGSGNLLLAGRYFVKSAEANLAQNEWLQRTWIFLAVAALVAAFLAATRYQAFVGGTPASWLSLLFLLIPLPFYALSIAYGGVPIFIPYWWPFTHYNVRYGLQLLPAFSVALALLVFLIVRLQVLKSRVRLVCVVAVLAVVIASYTSIWQSTPICLREAQVNMRTRSQLEAQLSVWLQKMSSNSTLLMYLGDHVGALERAGMPLKRTINEGNHRVWKQPADIDGLWERALANPPQYADYVLAFEGDPVWETVHNLHLHELVEIHVTGQARAVLYQAR
jgi:hypothetical protein